MDDGPNCAAAPNDVELEKLMPSGAEEEAPNAGIEATVPVDALAPDAAESPKLNGVAERKPGATEAAPAETPILDGTPKPDSEEAPYP